MEPQPSSSEPSVRRHLDRLREALASGQHSMPLGETLGYRLASIAEGEALIACDTDERHFNSFGYTHGGVICTLADTAIGLAALSTLNEGESSTTIELKMNFLRPIWKSSLRAVGRVVNAGRTLILLECEVRDERDRLIAKGSGTCMVLRGERASGR